MKKSAKIIVIILVLLAELAPLLWPHLSHGAVLDEPYRNAERKATLYAWLEQKTPETKLAYDAEVELLHKHMETRIATILIIGLAVNAIGFYLFWRYAPAKAVA